MKLNNLFPILSAKEKKVHAIIWLVGLIMINIPDWRVTMGPFHSDDYSLLIPSFYGVILNIYLFYNSSTHIRDNAREDLSKALKKSSITLLKVSLIEAVLDIIFYALFYWSLSKELSLEILWGQILMNGIFFYLPSIMFGLIKAWQKEEPEKQSEAKIILKDGAQTIHLNPNELTHVKSNGNYCIYHAEKKHLIRQSLSQAEVLLPHYFARSHKSFIVNLRMVEKHTYNDLIVGGFIIPIGRKYRKELKAILDS
ncbi:LytR/AlgR family response regulator transcription factor [Ekhidna sp.]|uniref:LytR/AlgR family response regulator transcription factor n=1 Tax=Ekhidna sp. TaxID=2608089 RepID=UPI003BA8CA5A